MTKDDIEVLGAILGKAVIELRKSAYADVETIKREPYMPWTNAVVLSSGLMLFAANFIDVVASSAVQIIAEKDGEQK